jgi:hypothetical protein
MDWAFVIAFTAGNMLAPLTQALGGRVVDVIGAAWRRLVGA